MREHGTFVGGPLARVLGKLIRDESGTMAVYTALLAVPLLSAVTYTIDLQAAVGQRTKLEAAADAAVLAAVNANTLKDKDRKAFTEDAFRKNYDGLASLGRVEAQVGDGRVKIVVEAELPTSISASVGVVNVDVAVQSEAALVEEDTICVFSLSEDAEGAITFSGDVGFSSPSCSVQSNSRNDRAILSTSSGLPSAKSFCTPGGADGYFQPAANTECRTIEDPYASLSAPVAGECRTPDALSEVLVPEGFSTDDVACHDISRDDDDDEGDDDEGENGSCKDPLNPNGKLKGWAKWPWAEAAERMGKVRVVSGLAQPTAVLASGRKVELVPGDSLNVVGDYATIEPGTYCGGLTIAGRDVNMPPGQYYMLDGPFVVKDGAEVIAPGVVVTLGGEGATLRVETLGDLEITAPQTGAHAGIAVMEDLNPPVMDSGVAPVGGLPGRGNGRAVGRKLKDPAGLGGAGQSLAKVSYVTDGALQVQGTIYLPTQHLLISGSQSMVGAVSPASAFIADTAEFTGSGTVVVRTDHSLAGLPPIKPRVEAGARLVR